MTHSRTPNLEICDTVSPDISPNSSPGTSSDTVRFGTTRITHRTARSILTPASGYISGYDFTLNPYQGCQYGCSYCYAAAFSPSQDLRRNWGNWVVIKTNATERLGEDLKTWYRRHPRTPPTIYMSTVTDPYQPLETKLQLTRQLLAAMQEVSPTPTLVIQTRSPLIVRDIDLLQRFSRLRINISIPTGSESVRRDFEGRSPSLKARFKAIQRLRSEIYPDKGFLPKISVTVTPTLPTLPEDHAGFIRSLAIADRIVLQPFHAQRRQSLGASTPEAALVLRQKYAWWYDQEREQYQQLRDNLRQQLPQVEVMEGREGFGYK